MKCPKCNGRGKTTEYDGLRKFWCDYKCEVCNGTGEFDPNEVDRFNAVDFIKVMEMVKKPQTNEEWLKRCTTEQLADVLLEHFEWGLSINAEYCFTEKYVEQNREHILEWLKQPHPNE